MKRYKIVNKGGGTITLMDMEGNITYVNEGVFHDTYTKLKQYATSAFAKFRELGGRVVAFVNGKVAQAITLFDAAKKHAKEGYLLAIGEAKAKAEELGIKVYGVDDVAAICGGTEDPYSSVQLALDSAYNSIVSGKPLTEAAHELKSKDAESLKQAAASIFAMGDDDYDEVAASMDNVRDANNKPIPDITTKLSTRLFSNGMYYDAASAKRFIEDHIRSIFTREYGEKSYSLTSRDSRGNKDINNPSISRIPLLYSIGGVGKTAILESVIDGIFSEKVGTDEGGDLYKVDRLPGVDAEDEDQYSAVMNKPLVFVIKCQGLSQDDIYMPAKDSRGLVIKDKLEKEHRISSEAVRGISTGLIPLIDTVNMTDEEAKAVDEAFGNIVIVFDELFMARPDAMNVLMSFAKERKINSWVLPSRCALVATTNRLEDFEEGSDTYENIKEIMTDQYKDRFLMIPYFMKYPEWREWATDSKNVLTQGGEVREKPNIDPVIISFLDQISNRFRFLNVFCESNSTDAHTGHSSPRAWTDASEVFVKTYKRYKRRIDNTQDQERRFAIKEFLDELKEGLDRVITLDDSKAMIKHTRTELFGVPNETMRSMWTTKHDAKISYKDISDGTTKSLTAESSGLAPQMLMNRLFNNAPIKFNDLSSVNSAAAATYHENLVNNIKIYYNNEMLKLKSFAKMFMIRLLKTENSLMLSEGFYKDNISDQEKIEIILGRTEGMNGKELVKLSAWKQYFDKF